MEPYEITNNIAVFHRANPGRIGILTGKRLSAMFVMAEVDWGNQREFVDVSQLVIRDNNDIPDADTAIRDGHYGTVDDLRRRITFEKLRGMLTDVLYSMKTSEIDFYAHQFKPVLRFIEAPTNRLLIADEVGLGKTIEAGLIWTEWQAREKARRLLIVCPPTLVPKWLRELQDKFQFSATAGDARKLLEQLHLFNSKGSGTSFVIVTSYHALRPFRKDRTQLNQLREGNDETAPLRVEQLSPRAQLLHRIQEQGEDALQNGNRPFIDMVVFDEAHSMKNTASASYVVGETFSTAAGATICLSATPIHNTSRDLYALMRLVDPEFFRDEYTFDFLRDRNQSIVKLQNALSVPDWQPEGIQPLISALPTDDAKTRMHEALSNFDGTSRGRVELRHLSEQLNLLNGFINRTRKRDVIENRVIRQPMTIPVTLTDQETEFYFAILRLIRREVQSRGEQVTSFHLIHPALRMSSSLPTIVNEVRAGKWGGFDEIEQLAEDFAEGFDIDDDSELSAPNELWALANYDFEANDSKYIALREALRLIAANNEIRSDQGTLVTITSQDKIIVFAFFKSTIAYLKRRLTADGIKAIAVTGDIQDQKERDQIFRQFADDENRVLLCSEIGAEGVDLQFARVVVNYDLPWNPMRVEQRIGRIDRIGQKSPSIVIINFRIANTIDGSIYSHLYQKIGIFEHSIGALEGILGEEVAKLTAEIFRNDLTMEQVAQRAEQTAQALHQRTKLEEDLENSTGALIAFQDLLSEKIGLSQRLGRFIKPAELRLHAEDFLATRYQGADACLLIPDNPAQDCIECELSFVALRDFENYCQQQDWPWPDGFDRVSRKVSLTFDPAIHQAQQRFRSLVLVTHLHPFFRWITNENEQVNNHWHNVSAIRVTCKDIPPARYFYLIYRMTLEGITKRDAFHYGMKNLATGELVLGTQAESLINTMLDDGESLYPLQVPDYTGVLQEVREALGQELSMNQRIFRQDQERNLEIRRQQINAHFERRIGDQLRRIETAKARDVKAGSIRGFETQLKNLRSAHNSQLAKLESKVGALQESFAEVASGFVEVQN